MTVFVKKLPKINKIPDILTDQHQQSLVHIKLEYFWHDGLSANSILSSDGWCFVKNYN